VPEITEELVHVSDFLAPESLLLDSVKWQTNANQ